MEAQLIISLLTLVALEIVLGIDNIIFISILANKLPAAQQKKARRYGLLLAAGLRIVLLIGISFILKLDTTLFTFLGKNITGKSLVLIAGGLFLIYKSTKEIYHKTEGEQGDLSLKNKATSFGAVLIQILIMDLVFSVDSIITAVGMVKQVWVMYVSVITSVILMLFAAEPISKFVNKHPAFKILALSFLLLIGVSLITEGMGHEIPKGYIYFSMGFSLLVDILQMKLTKSKGNMVNLNEHYTNEDELLNKKNVQ